MHLARQVNGLDPYRAFLDSYRRHPAGAPHELAIVLKGFDNEATTQPYRELAADICNHWLEAPDDGFDLGAYRRAALRLAHRHLVFVNSFSVIRADGWLDIMRSLAGSHDVGAVGAYGSWASQASHVRYNVGLAGPYQPIFVDRSMADRVFARLDPTPAPEATRAYPRRVVLRAWARDLIRYSFAFPAFPAPHLRTNCFLIERELWLRVCPRVPTSKWAAYGLESGRRGMTASLASMGFRVLVAGRDGQGYEASDWPASATLWQRDQENLLIEDNQTRAYRSGDDEVRLVLSRFAWGARAEPSMRTLEAER